MKPGFFAAAISVGIVFVVCLAAYPTPQRATPAAVPAAGAPMSDSIELQYVDDEVHARDDFYQRLNGKWLKMTEIPADQDAWGAFSELKEDTQKQLRNLIASLGSNPSNAAAKKIVALYTSFMDESRIESLGLKPIESQVVRIDALKDTKDIAALIAHFNQAQIGVPYEPVVHQDARNPTQYIVDLRQSGLGLPDRDYYIDDMLKRVREEYQAHIGRMLQLTGEKYPDKVADDIVSLETDLARAQWSKAKSRDPLLTYTKYSLADLPQLVDGYDWKGYFNSAGIEGKVDSLIISEPSYFTALGHLLQQTPLPVWKSYFRWRVLCAAAPYLGKALVDEHFAFYGTTLRGIPEIRPRWKRGVGVVNDSIGEELGRLYVKNHLSLKTKDDIDALIQVVLAAYRTSIKSLDWMGADAKKAQQDKLNKLVLKIGAPSTYRNYGKLHFDKSDLFGNVTRAAAFEYQRNIAKLGKPIDRDDWKIPPQAVTAYYDPQLNEIVLPAAILQSPFFNENAEKAVNYGGIGVIISREIAHGFDDRGRHYDSVGMMRDWLTGQDHAKFTAKTQALFAQYAADEGAPVSLQRLELRLSENIADNIGVAMAYSAYHLALAGKDAPVVNGLTGDQQFFARFAQVWRIKIRQADAAMRIDMSPRSPSAVGINATLKNQTGFYSAFGVEQGDKMYLPPAQRVTLW